MHHMIMVALNGHNKSWKSQKIIKFSSRHSKQFSYKLFTSYNFTTLIIIFVTRQTRTSKFQGFLRLNYDLLCPFQGHHRIHHEVKQKVSDFWSAFLVSHSSCSETMSNCSQNSWIDWNSAAPPYFVYGQLICLGLVPITYTCIAYFTGWEKYILPPKNIIIIIILNPTYDQKPETFFGVMDSYMTVDIVWLLRGN